MLTKLTDFLKLLTSLGFPQYLWHLAALFAPAAECLVAIVALRVIASEIAHKVAHSSRDLPSLLRAGRGPPAVDASSIEAMTF